MVNNFDFVGMIICLAAGTLLAMRTRAGRRVRLSA
jgi:branched-subunit amino acid ABC-type transport system permease component